MPQLVGAAGKRMQVAAISKPEDSLHWRWRIVNYAGEVVEESRENFATIANAVEQGSKRLRELNVVDNSVRYQPHQSGRRNSGKWTSSTTRSRSSPIGGNGNYASPQ